MIFFLLATPIAFYRSWRFFSAPRLPRDLSSHGIAEVCCWFLPYKNFTRGITAIDFLELASSQKGKWPYARAHISPDYRTLQYKRIIPTQPPLCRSPRTLCTQNRTILKCAPLHTQKVFLPVAFCPNKNTINMYFWVVPAPDKKN